MMINRVNNISQYKLDIVKAIINFIGFISLCRIFFTYVIPLINSQTGIIITALTSIIAVAGLFLLFAYLKDIIKLVWFLFVFFILLSYVNHFTGMEYICNTLTLLSLITILPYYKFDIVYIKLVFFAFSIFVLTILLFAPRFENDSDTKIKFNTNGSGFVLFTFEAIMAACAGRYKKGLVIKYVCYILIIVAIAFQFQFAGRSSLIGSGLLMVYLIFSKLFDKAKPRQVFWFSIFLCVFAIIFAYLYAIVLFEKIGKGNLIIFGKDIFTGRQEIWADAFKQLNGHWLFGIGNTLDSVPILDDTSGVTNLHNQMMGYLTCFGLSTFVAVSVLISLLLEKISKIFTRKYIIAYLLILILMSYFDTILYSTTNVIFIVCALICIYGFNMDLERRLYAKDNTLLLVREKQ